MRRVDVLVNGLVAHVDYEGALGLLRDESNWINAFPLTSGRYSSKLTPFKRHLAPIVLENLRVVSMMPFIPETLDEIAKRVTTKFAFAAILTLSSSEHEAVQFAVNNGTFLLERSVVTGVVWSMPEQVGAFDPLLPPEARST
jgi:hypothetical protein